MWSVTAFIVTSFLDALNGLGIGPALIYHKDEPETADTAFWLGLAVGIGLFVLTWIAAPFIGDYFNDERAVGVGAHDGVGLSDFSFG